jgi:RNA polymerase sigma factor (sigma-70 family)
MKIYDELYKHLNHLISTVSNCNFIPYEEKLDLVQESMIQLHRKIEEGRLSTDFKEIKGYSFMVLRNFCNKYHITKRDIAVEEFWELEDEQTNPDEIEYREYLHKLIKQYIQHHKYDDTQKRLCELLLEDYSDEEIRQETGMVGKEVGKQKFSLKNKMKYDVRRPVRYAIKNMNNKDTYVPCYSVADVKDYFPKMIPRRVTYMINEGYVTKDGYYVETLIKTIRKKKNE